MALKKMKKPELVREINTNKEEENKMQSIFTNSVNNEMVQKVEANMKEVLEGGWSNQSQDDFFNNSNEDVLGSTTPLTGFEIELQQEIAIAEGRYKFRVQNLDIERQVETKYGIKDKLIIQFHISRIRDTEEFAYDLKQKYNISSSYKSSFYQVYKDLTGEPPRGKINLRNLLGIKGSCEVKHIHMDNGDIFPRVVNINAEIYKDSSEVTEV